MEKMKEEMLICEVRQLLPTAERLAQLAEEAAELSKAALKLRRILTGVNPTPLLLEDACENLNEEVADILLCLDVIDFYVGKERIGDIKARKLIRWVGRLKEGRIG